MDKIRLLKAAALGAVIGTGAAAFIHKGQGAAAFISNALFFGGIVLLVYALFQYALHLGFFGGVIYSVKKIIESFTMKDYGPGKSQLGSRPEYEMENRRGRVCREEFAAAAVFLVLSLISAFL